MLRIIAGEHRGRILKTVDGVSTRPTSDRVKESLFNILQARIAGSTVLDLFSGTGNLGLEAMSRGSEHAVFVERDPRALAVLRDNCKALGMTSDTSILPIDVMRAIPELSRRNMTFDIVFMDPPYDKDLEPPVISALSEYRIVKPDGIIVVEHLADDIQPDSIADFVRYDMRKYGNTALSLYRKDASNDNSDISGQL